MNDNEEKNIKKSLDIPFYKKEIDQETKLANESLDQTSLVEKVHEQAKYDIVKNDEDVQKAILENAKKNIEVEMDTITNKIEKDNKKANMERNAEACSIFGYSSKDSVEKWQQRLMVIVYNILFCIYWLIASFTVAPINFVFGKIQVSIKKTWLAISLSVLIYCFLTIGLPLIINYISK